MAEIVVAGHICLDIIPKFLSDAEIAPGRLIEVGAADLSTGGAVANVGRSLHRLGVEVSLVGKIGDDPFGRIVAELLAQEDASLTQGLVVSKGGTTSYSVVINPPGRDRTFLHMPGENDTFTSADLHPHALQGARVLHFGYPPLMARMFADEGAELETLVRQARAAGVAVSLDLSLPDPSSPSGQAPWRRILKRVLPHVNLFFPSDTELAFMLGLPVDDTEEMIRQCLGMGAGMVVVKCGERGLVSASGRQPCFDVEVVGTTGSGDATIAGFLMGYVRGFPLAKCLEAGCAVGASCVEAADAVSGVRPWPETQARLDRGWATR